MSRAQNKSGRRYREVFVVLGISWLLLAVAFGAYTQLTPPQVEVTWETATEQDTAGFSLYRSESRNGAFVLVNEGKLIESRGSAVSGASYSYLDGDVERGSTYYYLLEEIETDGSRARYEDDIFEYRVPNASPWTLLFVVFCAVLGLGMIVYSFVEGAR